MSKRLLPIVLLVACAWNAFSQGGPAVAESAPDRATLYILFLHLHAEDAKRRSAGLQGADPINVAARLHVQPTELQSVDRAAVAFVTGEESLRLEATSYHMARIRDQKPIDPAVVHSFTVRRAALATAAATRLQSELSPGSYAGLERFVGSEFPQSIQLLKIRR